MSVDVGVLDGVHHPGLPRRVPPRLPHQLPGGSFFALKKKCHKSLFLAFQKRSIQTTLRSAPDVDTDTDREL